MASNHHAQEALLPILGRLYEEIRGIEAAHGLMAGKGDFRPRIEYFHDAVRAFTSGAEPYGKTTRLSVERLAYDLQFLNHLKSAPLAQMSDTPALSPRTEVAPLALAPRAGARMERGTRERLGELYTHYAVLFAALLKESADRNYQARVEDLNNDVQDLSLLEQLLPKLAKGMSPQELAGYVEHLENDELRVFLQQVMATAGAGKKPNVEGALKRIKGNIVKTDKETAGVEQAHFNFAAAQLSAYEAAKTVVKSLAQQGMNLAGKFLASAVSEAQARGQRGR